MIALCTYANEAQASRLAISEPVLRAYAQRHGYSVHVAHAGPEAGYAHYNKFHVLLTALKRGDWAVWFDADSLIVNRELALHELICTYSTPLVHCITSVDWNGPCTGIMAWRNSDWSRSMLAMLAFVRHSYHEPGVRDQSALRSVLVTYPTHWCRFSSFPTSVCRDQTLPFSSTCFTYHSSAGALTERYMQLVATRQFEEAAKCFPGQPHGLNFE